MRKLPVTLTVAASRDVSGIARYIARDNPSAARKFEDEFWLALDRVSMFPGTGHAILGGTFLATRVSQRFHRYSIIFRILRSDEIEIVRVLHGARDIASLLGASNTKPGS